MARRRKGWRRRRGRRGRRGFLVWVIALLLVGWLGWWYLEEYGGPDVVVRVLFAETAGCSARERELVAGVMRNRVGNAAFGGLGSVRAVVLQPGAFSCVGDAGNGNWRKSRHPERMTAGERRVWEQCVAVVNGEVGAAVGPSGRRLVYYHDKSIGMPRGWVNEKWRAVREVETEHFVFYSVVAGR